MYQVLNEISVSGSSLLNNYNYFTSKNKNLTIAPVLKSNAYGHGLIPVGQFVNQNLKPSMICVDSLYEAYELHQAGVITPVLIMGYTNPENFRVWKKLPFAFSVYDLDTVRALAKYQPGARVHIKLDTGMYRLGLLEQDIPAFVAGLKQIGNLQIEGIFSHLSQADDPSKTTFTKNQISSFKRMVSLFENEGFVFKWRHIASTAGAEVINDSYFNLVRLGIGFYGVSPFGPHTAEGRRERKELKPALTLSSHIVVVKDVIVGGQVGYGGTYTAKQNEKIAILPLGYNEGVSRSLSNLGIVIVKNTSCPIVGRVSMNMTAIKLTRNTDAKIGDPVTIISPDAATANSVYQLAKIKNTIPYEVLTSLHSSIRRRII